MAKIKMQDLLNENQILDIKNDVLDNVALLRHITCYLKLYDINFRVH